MSGLREFGLAFVAIFVALDAIGMLPLYLSMTHAMGKRDRDRVTDVSLLVAFLVAVAFMVGGQALFGWLGISLFDFRIAGGVVLLLLSLAELVHKPEAETRASGSTGVVPLAVPLITGPAVLTTLVLQVSSVGYGVTLFALLVNYALAWILLRQSAWVTRLIGKDGTTVISKIVALLLAAIAVAMIRAGVFEAVLEFRKL